MMRRKLFIIIMFIYEDNDIHNLNINHFYIQEIYNDKPKLKILTQLRAFLSAIGYYRKFIFNFAQTGKQFYDLTKKGVICNWNN